MDRKEAIEFLKEKVKEADKLKKLPHNNQDVILWRNSIEYVLEDVFGRDSLEYKHFYETRAKWSKLTNAQRQKKYVRQLIRRRTEMLSIINKYDKGGFKAEMENEAALPPKAFIAHGGDSPALGKLKSFLVALGVQPLVVEEQASEGRSVGEKVDWYSQQADCAIILATKGDIDGKTGDFIPRGNVLMEIGKLQHLYKGKIVYLLQANAKFPSNISEKVWVRFSPQSMDNSFTTVARELKAFGILKAVRP